MSRITRLILQSKMLSHCRLSLTLHVPHNAVDPSEMLTNSHVIKWPLRFFLFFLTMDSETTSHHYVIHANFQFLNHGVWYHLLECASDLPELALHQTHVHRGPQKTNKVLGLTNLKDYGEGYPYFNMLCSSTINFHCGTKPNKLCHHTSSNFDGFMIRFEGLRKKYWIFSVWWRYYSKTRT
jgi:hypothetical protein